MSPNSCSTCKLPIVGSDLLCVVNSEWFSNNCVKLLVLHSNQAWSGKFQVTDDEDTKDLLDQLSMNEHQYIEETRRALTTHGGAESFAYTIDCDKFMWKKYVSKNMAVRFGFINLQKESPFGVFEEIVDKNLQENSELRTQLERASQQNETFTEENHYLNTKLNDLIEKKSEMEASLYSQFVFLLNEKKRRINELQNQFQANHQGGNEQGVGQSDSDPFGSDTELDSEEDQSPSKAESRVSAAGEEENVCVFPKKLRTPSKLEGVAGPSGLCHKSKNNRGVSKSPSSDEKETKKPQSKGKKSQKVSCVMGKILDNDEQNSSEEDVFMFPKRSKRVSSSVELVKPSRNKIKYDSDDEMPLNKTQKIEIDSDSTPSGIDSIDEIKTITVKNPDDINLKTANFFSIIDERNNDSRCVKNSDKEGTNGKKIETAADPSFKDFSNSTLAILNQLI